MNLETIAPMFVERALPIATREFFPSELRGAYRQRARWLIGIVFQGTSSHGWEGNAGTRYFLFRDRKGIFSGPVVILGYFALANLLLIELYLATFAPEAQFDFVLLGRDYVMDLLYVNLIFLTWRLVHRVIFTTRIFDWRQGLMAAPRLIVSNFVNFFAAVRATRIYVLHRLTGRPLIWDKTSHTYPIKFRHEVAPPADGGRRGNETMSFPPVPQNPQWAPQ
jgi:adsorption protein B